METTFLKKEYVALSLINAKNQIFCEKFITTAELNQFTCFLQEEFNKRGLKIIITSTLSRDDFNIIDGVITTSDACSISLDFIPMNVLPVLHDSKVIVDFLIQLEKNKLETLERAKSSALKLYRKK